VTFAAVPPIAVTLPGWTPGTPAVNVEDDVLVAPDALRATIAAQ
jgi:hypothetical protein